jgi:type II secretory pathway component PulF
LSLSTAGSGFLFSSLFRRRLNTAAENLKAGVPLSVSVRVLRMYLPDYVIPALHEAEKSNCLKEVLPLIASQMRYSGATFRKRSRGFIYPIVLFMQIFFLLSFLFIFVVPKFNRIFDEMYNGATLLPVTAAVFFVQRHFPAFVLVPCLLLFAAAVLLVIARFEPFAGRVLEFFILHIPFIRKDFKRTALLEFSASMATFLECGMDMCQAAEMVKECVSSVWLRRRTERFIKSLQAGNAWQDAFISMEISMPFYHWLAAAAAVREKPAEGFSRMVKYLKRDISAFTFYFIAVVEFFGILLNSLTVGFVITALGAGLFSMIYRLF